MCSSDLIDVLLLIEPRELARAQIGEGEIICIEHACGVQHPRLRMFVTLFVCVSEAGRGVPPK